MRKVKRKKVVVLKRWVRIAIVLFLFALAGIATYLICTGFVPTIQSKSYYNYNIKRNIDYKVYLKKNDFYQDNYLDSGMQYPSALIDYIDIVFWFNYGDSKQTDLEYSYDIKGKLVGEYTDAQSGKQEILTKEYDFVDEVTDNLSGTEININKKIRVKYDDYNDFINEYKSTLKLAIDAYFEVTANITYKSKLSSENVSGEEQMIVRIPLSKVAINIDTKYKDDQSESLVDKIIKYNYVQIYIGFILAVLFIVLFIELREKLFFNDKTLYHKTLDKILKDYSEIIAKTSTPIDVDNLTVYEISDFDDLVDIEEEVKSPILLYEAIPGKVCHFVVIKNIYAYRFILKVNEKKQTTNEKKSLDK